MRIIDYIKSKFCRVPVYLNHYLSNEIVINGYFSCNEDGTVKPFNFGDDINVPLLNLLTGRPVKQEWRVGLRNLDNLLCIGSILESCSERSLIWGTGAMYGDVPLKCKPKKVYAVRGKLTRQYLLKNGVECPEIYGDPALLLPLVYKPIINKKYKIGFIPHYIDYNLSHVVEFREKHPEFLFVKLQDYSSWENVIDQICSCEYIVSSSLHGLIVSDAYGIPNIRVKFSDKLLGGDFKFKDYMSGVGRKYSTPLNCMNMIDLPSILRELNSAELVQYDCKQLIHSFPYKLKESFR